jgi:hypothetical protein
MDPMIPKRTCDFHDSYSGTILEVYGPVLVWLLKMGILTKSE